MYTQFRIFLQNIKASAKREMLIRLTDKVKIKEPLYLFILAPNNSGSTALIKYLNTSANNSILNDSGEGQWLPSVKNIMRNNPWDPATRMPWEFIKNEYLKTWNYCSSILSEKSPPNLLRGEEIQQVFSDVKFIILIRNPYAQISSCFYRYYNECSLVEWASDWLWKVEYQKRNLEILDKALLITYEEFSNETVSTGEKILDFCPELESLDNHCQLQVKDRVSNIKDFNN